MKKQIYKASALFILALSAISMQAQTVSTFENLSLSPNTYWNGSSSPMGTTFTDGNAIFPNFYDTSWGGFWAEGFAYSNVKDSVTPGFGNLYATRPAEGYNGSSNYAVSQNHSILRLTGNALGKVVNGMYVTNSSYAAISMRDGDMFAKKFGGISGNDPDWFKLVIRNYYNGSLTGDSVEFYLADFRFSTNADDYIVTTWEWVDLSPLGNTDSLIFELSSSDVGQWGMNTPAFFCIDNFTTADIGVGLSETPASAQIRVFPNPAHETITIQHLPATGSEITILDNHGRIVLNTLCNEMQTTLSVEMLPPGCYIVHARNNEGSSHTKFIKAQ